MEKVEQRRERVIASFPDRMRVRGETPRKRHEKGDGSRNERHEGEAQRHRARVEGDPGGHHRHEGGEKARVESAHEPADSVCVARQFGDDLPVGECRKLGWREIQDGVKCPFLQLQFDSPRARQDEPLKEGRQDGPGDQQRGNCGKRSTRRHPADERVDETSGCERNRDPRDG